MMDKDKQSDQAKQMAPFRINSYLIQPALNRITVEGKTSQVEPRLIQILICLASQPGRVVSRQELIKKIWPDSIVCEESLTKAISSLRRILRDQPSDPTVIETIRKGGYRLIAEVTPEPQPAVAPFNRSDNRNQDRLEPGPESSSIPESIAPKYPRGSVWLLLGVGLAAIAIIVSLLWPGSEQVELSHFLAGNPVTSYVGRETHPAISPDGVHIAFCWSDEANTAQNIYVKQTRNEPPLRLTDYPAAEYFPAWSPDGASIAYFRSGPGSGIYLIPALGGRARRLYKTSAVAAGLDWSPDGQWLVFPDSCQTDHLLHLKLLSLSTQKTKRIETDTSAGLLESQPAFSPDGKSIAFVQTRDTFHQYICLVPALGGEIKRLTHDRRKVFGLDWTPDGEHLIVGGGPQGDSQLWRYTLADSSMKLLPTTTEIATSPHVSSSGNRLVFEQLTADINIYRFTLPEKSAIDEALIPLIESTRSDYLPQYSPDGSMLLFVSARSGTRELWLSDTDGQNPRQLTRFNGPPLAAPLWSPDGQQVVVSALIDDYFNIQLINIEESRYRSLQSADVHQFGVEWSRNGKWIYLENEYQGSHQYQRLSVDSTELVDLSSDDITGLQESADGGLLIYSRYNGDIWKRDLTTGIGELLVCGLLDSPWQTFIAVERGLYFTRGDRYVRQLAFFDFASREQTDIYDFPADFDKSYSISPDEKYLVFDRARIASDLIVVEDFH